MSAQFPPAAGRRPPLEVCHRLALAVLIAGCTHQDGITKYDAPRVDRRAAALDPDEIRSRLDHMFAAIVPAGEKAWFFKLVVPGAVADKFRQPFDDFLAAVNAAPDANLPSWKLAPGWTERPGNDLRAATIVIPHEGAEYELTVLTLPLAGPWSDYVKQNVDRWLGQLQEAPLDQETIEKLARTLPTAGQKATVFEFVGVMQRAPMGGSAMPPGHPPLGDGSAADASEPARDDLAAPNLEFDFDLPDGWKLGPPNAMRKATFAIDGGGEVAVTAFGASGQMGDPQANAERWAAQVGMTDLSASALAKLSQPIDVDGTAGQFFEFFAPPGVEPAQAILAAMVVRGNEAWFFKLSGERTVAEKQRETFRTFLETVRFRSRP